jgi:hypothetical protein
MAAIYLKHKSDFTIFVHDFALWCNGNTSAFGADVSGSSPGGATTQFYKTLLS